MAAEDAGPARARSPTLAALTSNQQRDFIGGNQNIIDMGLGMNILRLVYANYAESPDVIVTTPGKEEPYINLGQIEDGMVDRIYRMVCAQKERLSGERSGQ